MASLIKKFSEISTGDVAEVGGKNASLGELISKLAEKGIQVPDGFATTASAFRMFLDENKLEAPLKELMGRLDKEKCEPWQMALPE